MTVKVKEEQVAAKDEPSREKKTTVEKPVAKSRNKRLIMIGGISVLIVVIAASVSVFLYMRNNSGDGDAAEAGVEKKEVSADAKKTLAIYPLEPFIVNIHDGKELRYLKVKLEFEIASPAAKEEIDPFQAPMRDAILVLLSGKNLEDIAGTDGKNKLRNEVMATVAKVVPPGKVNRVYFTDFVVQ
jgi:flagellar FliL protein